MLYAQMPSRLPSRRPPSPRDPSSLPDFGCEPAMGMRESHRKLPVSFMTTGWRTRLRAVVPAQAGVLHCDGAAHREECMMPLLHTFDRRD